MPISAGCAREASVDAVLHGKTPFVAAVEITSLDRKPRRLKLQVVKGFRKAEIAKLAQSSFAAGSNVVSDGLSCWQVVTKAGCDHFPMLTGSGKKAAQWPSFNWVNTTARQHQDRARRHLPPRQPEARATLPCQLRLALQSSLPARHHDRAPGVGRGCTPSAPVPGRHRWMRKTDNQEGLCFLIPRPRVP